jgi:sec-independent protein translocase protein TatC
MLEAHRWIQYGHQSGVSGARLSGCAVHHGTGMGFHLTWPLQTRKALCIAFIVLSLFYLSLVGVWLFHRVSLCDEVSSFYGQQNMGMTPVISGLEYFDQFIAIELCLGVVFELPALMFILSRFGLVSASFFLSNTKYAILVIFIVAAVITPTPDIPDMLVVAVPMLALYLFGVAIAFLFGQEAKSE